MRQPESNPVKEFGLSPEGPAPGLPRRTRGNGHAGPAYCTVTVPFIPDTFDPLTAPWTEQMNR
jgi:hypothetical protein